MNIGYARVSTLDQTLALQRDALAKAECNRVFTDTMSGTSSERPGLAEALDYVRAGDVLVVWKLDRLGRSLKYLIETINQLNERGIGFRSLTEQIDTTTPGGKLIFHLFGSLAEFERDLIRERTQAGLAAARARGRQGAGRESSTHRGSWRWRGRCMPITRTRSRTSAAPSVSLAPRSIARSAIQTQKRTKRGKRKDRASTTRWARNDDER